MAGFLKRGLDLHNKLHEHYFTRRLDVNDVSQPRVGHPLDVTIKFIQASGIPRMDAGPGGLADPYFIANIDGKTSYVSTAQPNTLTPVWNETWMIANVPSDAKLRVDCYDKDEGSIVDDYIGSFTVYLKDGAQVQTLKGLTNHEKGTMGFQITTVPSQNQSMPAYSFNGPIRYSRHFSPTAGIVTKLSNPNGSLSRLWSTWKIALKGIPMFFGDHHQHWNLNYKAAQTIFQGPLSITVRAPIQAGHRLLYARKTSSTFGLIDGASDFWALFRAGDDRLPSDPLQREQQLEHRRSSSIGRTPTMGSTTGGGNGSGESRIKPAIYTYVIGEDSNFRFSETGASFFVDFASKHALHSCCAETVRYSGEFHPRPVMEDGSGWAGFREELGDEEVEWELVIDNNSGTYAPDKTLLPALADLLRFNFPGLRVIALDFKSDEAQLDASRKACREYAMKYRGVAANQLQPSKTMVEQATGGEGGGSLYGMAKAEPAELVMAVQKQESTSSENPDGAQVGGPGMMSPNPPATAPSSSSFGQQPSSQNPSFPAQPAERPAEPQQPSTAASGPGAVPDAPPPEYGSWIPAGTSTMQDGMPEAKIWMPPPQAF